MNPILNPIPNLPQDSYNVIIPLEKSTNKFNRKVYIPTMTEGKITSEEVNELLEDLELITSQFSTPLGKLMTLLHRFVLPFFVMLFLTNNWYCGSDDYEYNYHYDYYRHIRNRTWVPFFIYCIIMSIYQKLNHKYKMMKARGKADSIIQIHQSKFNKKGYRLFVPFNFLEWIEIQRDSYPQRDPVPSVDQFNLRQNVSQLLHAPVVQNIREYGNSAFQPLINMGRNPNQNNQTHLLNPNNQVYPIYVNGQGYPIVPYYYPNPNIQGDQVNLNHPPPSNNFNNGQ